MRTVARTISRSVWERLQRGPAPARVLAVFERACDLVTANGEVIGLVVPEVGEGPLNVVVEGRHGPFDGLQAGMSAQVSPRSIAVGPLRVDLSTASIWEPRPEWETLRAHRSAIEALFPTVRELALREAWGENWLALLLPSPTPPSPLQGAVLARVRDGLRRLQEGWEGNLQAVRAGAARLAGLGGGLTPSGDDFLTGVMLRAWLTHPDPATFCQTVVEAAAPATHALSAAFLRAAARGECNIAWHHLLAVLTEGNEEAIPPALQEVLSYGASSGADALAGFLAVPVTPDA
ncbi:MAG TPA: DUF2877 domain-containing protein [Chloroflexi bacterium]|nr:DUF2877 domain-containing protein [Chloroflexota bacterium]